MKNKTSANVAKVVREVLFCVYIPKQMLRDNGPEFFGLAFQQMLNDWGTEHVRTTP